MKKFLLLTFAFIMVLSLAACGSTTEPAQPESNESASESSQASKANAEQSDESTIVGSWKYESGGFIYTFNEDGTGTYDALGSTMEFTYSDDGSTLSITYTGNTSPTELPYQIDGNQVTIKDSFGEDTVYIRES